MQKRWLAILLAAMLTVSMTACGSGDTNNDSTSDKTDQNQTTGDQTANTGVGNSDVEYTEITLNIAGSAAESHPVSQGMLYWEKLVEERSGGAVQVEAFLNALSEQAPQSSSQFSPVPSNWVKGRCLLLLPSALIPSIQASHLHLTPVNMPMHGRRPNLHRHYMRKL